VVAFALSREIVRLNHVMHGVSRTFNNQMSYAEMEDFRRHFEPVFPAIERLWREDGETAVILVNTHLFFSTLITAYVLYRLFTARRRMNRQEGGTQPATLCISIDGKEECVDVPDEMVGFITDIVMRMKESLPPVERLIQKMNRSNTTRKNLRNRNTTRRNRTRGAALAY
jgi:hypothetical protein